MKYSLLYSILFSLTFSGCYFTFNAAMCDNIAMDPNGNNIPQECRNYNEEEADKAFHQTKHKSTSEDEDIIKFQQEEEDK